MTPVGSGATRHRTGTIANRQFPLIAAAALGALAILALALLRAPDHDESQYVAAAVLTAHGLLPYRDFAWLQTPLQPFAFAPLAAAFGSYAWPGLRLTNALLGLLALGGLYRAGRTAGAEPRAALTGAVLLAGCDAFLFGAGTARNDMLPLALFAWGLAAALRADGGRSAAMLAGLLFAGAAAAKVSYAFPAGAYGLWCLCRPRHRHAAWVALEAAPALLLIATMARIAPAGFWFGTFTFPTAGPLDYYAARADKLGIVAKALDVAKFLALGAAPVAIAAWRPARSPPARLLDVLILAGLVAAVMPTPVWRQYLLPFLAPLFVRLALAWQAQPPGRGMRIATMVFLAAGIAPSLLLPWSFPAALGQGTALRAHLDAAGVRGPVVTLAPQFLAATGRLPDPRFATGPFVYRSRALLSADAARALGVAVRGVPFDLQGRAVVIGGEGRWTAGDIALDRELARAAMRQGYRATAVPRSRFVVLLPSTPS